MDRKPAILICSTYDDEPEYLIRNILTDENARSGKINNEITTYPWNMDNKYYTAEVYFYLTKSKFIHLESAESIEAVVLFVDRIPLNFIEQFDYWVTKTKSYTPAVQLVVCRYCVDEQRSDSVLQWCIENRFELVELESKDEEENDYEVNGITRIIEALQAHKWSNMVLKGDAQNKSCHIEKHTKEDENTFQNSDLPPGNEYSALESSEDNIDELSTLFKNLRSMKQEVSSMSGTERLDHAEKVVRAFWNAVNGDSDEFDDEDESDYVT